MSLFNIGKVVATPGALAKISKFEIALCVGLHSQGKWGNLSEEDKEINEKAVVYGDEILSSYTSKNGVNFLVVTELNKSVTTVLLPSELIINS